MADVSPEPRWFAGPTVWAVRIVGLAITVALLWWIVELQSESLNRAGLTLDWGRYWLIQTVYVLTGISFTVAVRFPFPRQRFAWGRLAIAGIFLLPTVHLWYALQGMGDGPGLLNRFYWFDGLVAAPILAGVAIGSGFGARRSAEEPENR